MVDRQDPPHERVRLTAPELRTIAALERILAEDRPSDSSSPRRRRLQAERWLLPIAVIVVVTALSISIEAAAYVTGAVFAGLAAAAWAQAGGTRRSLRPKRH